MKSTIILISVFILGILSNAHAWSTPVHNAIILKAFPNESINCILKIFEGSRYVDEYQGNPLSYLHAMRSSNQNDEEAIKMTWDFVAFQYDKAREPNISEDDFCYYRGMALHPVMDSTSLAHQHGDKPLEWHNPLESLQDLSNPMNIFRAIFLHGDEWQAEAIPYVKEFLRLSGIYLKPGTLESLDLSLEDTVFIEKHPEFVDLTVGLVRLVDQVYLLGVERDQNDDLFGSMGEEGTPGEDQEEVGIDEIKVHVHTNDDNKDHNTGVEFQTFTLDGGLIAETGVMRGEEYNDGSDKYFTLTKKNLLLKENLFNGGKLRICIDPIGGFKRDTWKFNADITIRYSDGSQTTRTWNEVIVSQNKKEEYLPWDGQ